jgi:uncharacterized protein
MRSAFLCVVATLSLLGCDNQTSTNIFSGEPMAAYVEVQGKAELKASPDRFQLRAAFTLTGPDVAAMKAVLDQQLADALGAARALGIDEKNLRASTLSVQPEWQWQPERKLIGQRVSRDLHITADGLDIYVALLERLAALGVSELHQAGAEISDLSALEDKALQQAVANARHRANILAASAGRTLGDATVIVEQGSQLPGPVPMRAMAMEAQTDQASYSAGETVVHSQVLIRFRLN